MGNHRKQSLREVGACTLAEALLKLANRQALNILGQICEHSNLKRPPVPTWLLKNIFA